MTEQDYINATNLAKVVVAKNCIRDMLVEDDLTPRWEIVTCLLEELEMMIDQTITIEG